MAFIESSHYSAWHIPCYENFNCPKRIVKSESDSSTKHQTQEAGIHRILGSEITDVETGFVAFFLWFLFLTSVAGICITTGLIFARRGIKRPYNQFLFSLVISDALMTCIALPLHGLQILSNENQSPPFGSSVCIGGTFIHLVSTCSRSWTIAAFIFLYQFCNGLISPRQSGLTLSWIWLASGLLSIPIFISGDGGLVNSSSCTLVTDHFGMIVYITVINFGLPSLILSPMFIRWSHLTRQFNPKNPISDLDFGEIHAQERTEQLCEEGSVNGSVDSLENYRKPSRATNLFLVADKNFPRTLFTMAVLNAVTWGPFYILIFISPFLISSAPQEVFLLSSWLGFSQSLMTPFFIYLMSDRASKIFNDLVCPFIRGKTFSRQLSRTAEVKVLTQNSNAFC